ncbi:DUF4129 domain-containing protein [Halobacterium salinarum]|uniref:DUF4129 domain protein n=6 Tax=Halobacterium salinarum TaxID=2242 RepID=A0A510N498_HALSA|nr:DUF4129 domain-containing protein [Halobacterium salinarum]MBB6090663.1 hypothetical protein [Halobacterium salinarum]QCC44098.1 DUF4129 domain protein [Halobacterium salinarum]TYO76854.1 protein of unknown function (DUF4129) [Halobacterium salinarum DSM 3754]UEB92246.1 DUF4129 domain-containing protein [Halobacterium salinarum NRC-34001]CAP13077.2 DUF4129 domain protein [Halobacterium salinarum R1]
MGRNARGPVIAVLCVLAISLAASTLVAPRPQSGAGPGTGGNTQSGGAAPSHTSGAAASATGGQSGATATTPTPFDALCVPVLQSPAVLIGIGIALVGAVWLLARRNPLAYALAVVIPVVPFLVLSYGALTDCRAPASMSPQHAGAAGSAQSPPANGSVGGGTAGGQPVTQLVTPSLAVGVLAVVAVLFVVLAYHATGDDTATDRSPDPATREPAAQPRLAAVGAAAGQAAARIETVADVDNEVYRAWREMAAHVDVSNPEASTPREFAAAARDAGMDARHVDALTALFRAVRYGDADPSPAREARAVDALRAIEARYTDGGQ